MNAKNLSRLIVLFVTLTVAGVCLIVLPQSAAQPILRQVLPLVGAAMLSSALTTFMVVMLLGYKK
jgi:hypothetical protein